MGLRGLQSPGPGLGLQAGSRDHGNETLTCIRYCILSE
jgi:hypothetical protein